MLKERDFNVKLIGSDSRSTVHYTGDAVTVKL